MIGQNHPPPEGEDGGQPPKRKGGGQPGNKNRVIPPERKKKQRTFKATDEEFEKIKENAKAAGMGVGEYIRKMTIGKSEK